MAFRRNFERADDAQIRRKVIMLIGTIILVVLLINLAWNYAISPKPHIISVEMISRDQFVVQTDTTNYNKFASTLKQRVIQAKKEHLNNQIQLTVPTTAKKSTSITDIIMIVAAMDLDWEIKNK
ncbi:hypothetical protein [Aureispira anguillae]|uniref:Uncharacterized protein n=1 Tax=Aureispira anguillae TaxID=2864201 RepID=A0A915YD03_9BACT|nr:hypothetical protein [Aureispira anguillae]BDS10798.1 hypothetical protein AsAng_0015070 [Aureispira anguillae]